jgi:hypothetical protein
MVVVPLSSQVGRWWFLSGGGAAAVEKVCGPVEGGSAALRCPPLLSGYVGGVKVGFALVKA